MLLSVSWRAWCRVYAVGSMLLILLWMSPLVGVFFALNPYSNTLGIFLLVHLGIIMWFCKFCIGLCCFSGISRWLQHGHFFLCICCTRSNCFYFYISGILTRVSEIHQAVTWQFWFVVRFCCFWFLLFFQLEILEFWQQWFLGF